MAAVPRRAEIHGDRVADFEDVLRPARTGQYARGTALDLPRRLAALAVVDRQKDPHVRVRPLPLRDRAFEHDHLLWVERRGAVVREGGCRRQQHRDEKRAGSHMQILRDYAMTLARKRYTLYLMLELASSQLRHFHHRSRR